MDQLHRPSKFREDLFIRLRGHVRMGPRVNGDIILIVPRHLEAVGMLKNVGADIEVRRVLIFLLEEFVQGRGRRQRAVIKAEAKVTIGSVPDIIRDPALVGGRAYVGTHWIIAVRVCWIGTGGSGGDGDIGNLASRDGFIEGVKPSLGHVLHGSRVGGEAFRPFGRPYRSVRDAVVLARPPEKGMDWVTVGLVPSAGRKAVGVILARNTNRLDRRGDKKKGGKKKA